MILDSKCVTFTLSISNEAMKRQLLCLKTCSCLICKCHSSLVTSFLCSCTLRLPKNASLVRATHKGVACGSIKTDTLFNPRAVVKLTGDIQIFLPSSHTSPVSTSDLHCPPPCRAPMSLPTVLCLSRRLAISQSLLILWS